MAEASRSEDKKDSKLLGGFLLILVGILFTLNNFDVLDIGSIFEFWPLFLIWIGYKNFRFPDEAEDQRTGMWLLAVGSILLLLNLEVFGLGWDEGWPLLLIGAGGVLIWQTLALPGKSECCQEDANGC